MMWQDYVIFACMLAFSYALVPQVIHDFRQKKSSVNRQTSVITTVFGYVVAFTYWTLGLAFSTAVQLVISTMWLALVVQSIRYGK